MSKEFISPIKLLISSLFPNGDTNSNSFLSPETSLTLLVERNIDAWKREIESAKRHALAEAKAKVFKNFLKNL